MSAQCDRPSVTGPVWQATGYLAWFKLPVVDDTGGDDGSVIPVARAAVVLARVVTLPRLAGNTPYGTGQGRTGQGRAGQDRTGQDRSGHETKHNDSVLHRRFEVTTSVHLLTAPPTPR